MIRNSKLEFYLDKHKFSEEDKTKFLKIILPIFLHPEFQKRMNSQEFPHHSDTSLGEHIIEVAIVSYLLSKKKSAKTKCDIELATKIAMFHDLYEYPWKDTPIKSKNFIHKHGFAHPLEAVINAYTWFPESFDDFEKSKIIIDGIIHHMHLLPVLCIDENTLLNNMHKYKELPDDVKLILANSSLRKKFNVPGGALSLSRSKFLEGKIVSKADKIVTFSSNNLDLNDILICIAGKKEKLEKNKKPRN